MTAVNLSVFTAQVNAWAAKHATGLSMDVILRKLTLDSLVGVTNYTPVDTGYCRFNWLVSVNRPDTSVEGKPGTVHDDYKGSVGKGMVAGKVPGKGTYPPFSVVYVQNNVEYAEALNDGGPTTEAHQMIERAKADLLAELATPGVVK